MEIIRRPLSKEIEGLEVLIAALEAGSADLAPGSPDHARNAAQTEYYQRERARWIAQRDRNGREWLRYLRHLERIYRDRHQYRRWHETRRRRGRLEDAYPHLMEPRAPVQSAPVETMQETSNQETEGTAA